MLKRFLALFIFGALLTASAAACGGGGGAMSLEDYFQELDTIFADVDSEFTDLEEQEYPEVFVDPDQTRDYMDKAIPLIEGAVGDVRDLNPPQEAEDAHEEFLDAADDVVEAYGTLSDGMEDVESEEQLDEVMNELGAEVAPVFERSDGACFALQDIADKKQIDVNLDCGETGGF